MTRRIRVAHLTTVDLTLRFILRGHLLRLKDEGFDVATVSAPGKWTSELEAEGIRHISWRSATRAWDPLSDARAFFELLRILKREQFDLVHTHTPKAGIMGRVAARLAGVPCVVNSVHGFYTTPDDRLLRRLPVLGIERFAALFSDLEFYASEEDLAWARRIGVVKTARSRFLGNGVDLQRFNPSAVPAERLRQLREDLGIPREARVVGTVGRLVGEKGYRELFAAARQVRREMPETRFVVVGAPDEAKSDTIRAGEIGQASEDIVFTGWIGDVRDFLALMDVFVLPSWREGQPLSAIEAAAMAKPLILTDIRGCREVVRHGVEGLLIPPRSAERLASAIARMLRDEQLRDRLGTAARERAIARFDENLITDKLILEYRELLARKGLTSQRVSLGENSVRIRRGRTKDAAVLADIHRRSLPGAFLSSLGHRFLRRLYTALTRDQSAVVVIAEDGDGIAGFATGVPSVRQFYRRFYLRHGLPAAVSAAPYLLSRRMIRQLRETGSYPGASRDLPDAELLSIAVDPRFRSRGVGKALAERILDGLSRRGATEIKVVVGAENEGANRFYEGIGFEHLASISVHEGIPSNVWIFRCHSSSPSGSLSS